jgi:hypothetical protein
MRLTWPTVLSGLEFSYRAGPRTLLDCLVRMASATADQDAKISGDDIQVREKGSQVSLCCIAVLIRTVAEISLAARWERYYSDTLESCFHARAGQIQGARRLVR